MSSLSCGLSSRGYGGGLILSDMGMDRIGYELDKELLMLSMIKRINKLKQP